MKWLRSFAVVAFVLLGALTAHGEEGLKITEMVVTTKIVRGNPIDSVRRISSTSVKALYCFTRTVGPEEETVLKHVWYRNNEKVAENELPIKGKRWRTYSKIAMDRQSPGQWRVEALDATGNVLKKVEFRIN